MITPPSEDTIPAAGARVQWRLYRIPINETAAGVRVTVEVHGKLIAAVTSAQDVAYLDQVMPAADVMSDVIDLAGLRHAVMNGLQALYLECPQDTADMVRTRVLLYLHAVERKYGINP